MSLEEWNQRYRAREEIDDEPAPLLVGAASDLPPGRALDLACGAGRNAVWLERRGWDVVAVDGAVEAIRIVAERDSSIDARVLDLESGERLPFVDKSFDLVAILYFLHRPLFAEAKRVLRTGGTIVAAVRIAGINPKYCVAPGELSETFADFEILHESEGETAEVVGRKKT